MELPQVGKNCNLKNCNSLDFLPVICPFCQEIFCGDHRLPLNHNCTQWNQVDKLLIQCEKCLNLVRAPEQPKMSLEIILEKHLKSSCKKYVLVERKDFDRKCFVQGCFDIDSRIGPVRCEGCDQGYCLKHRHPSTHHCESLFADGKKKLERKLAAQEKVAKTLKLPGNTTKQTMKVVPAKSKSGGMVELMKMKAKAKGDSSVPLSSRIYLYVQCPKSSNMDSLLVYFDKKNSVGRTLDTLAGICNITNKNNMVSATDPERLYLYKCPEMTCMDNSTTLEKVVKNLDTILIERQAATMASE